METFGKKLVKLRKQKRLSQEQLAGDLYLSQSSISNYESGATTPNIDILKKIADYFNVPTAYFFSDEKTFFHIQENNGGNIGIFNNSVFHTLYETLIEPYENRIRELKNEIQKLKNNT